MDRCVGHCCAGFTLPLSPQELQDSCAQSVRLERGEPLDPDLSPRVYNEVQTVASMVIYLGKRKSDVNGQPIDAELHYYTCKHHDKATGDCGIYETRPQMCRTYPHGTTCLYKDCQWKAAKEGRVDWDGNVLSVEEKALRDEESAKQRKTLASLRSGHDSVANT